MEFGGENDPEMTFNPDYEITSDVEEGSITSNDESEHQGLNRVGRSTSHNESDTDERATSETEDESEDETDRSNQSESNAGNVRSDDNDQEEKESEEDSEEEISEEIKSKNIKKYKSNRDNCKPSPRKLPVEDSHPQEDNHNFVEENSGLDLYEDLSNLSTVEKHKPEHDINLVKSGDISRDIYADVAMDGQDFKTYLQKCQGSCPNLDLYSEFLIEEVSTRPTYDQLLKEKDVNNLKVEELKASLQKFIQQNHMIQEESMMLRKNISSLYKTAQTEIKRKDKEIAMLVRKLDTLQPMRFQALMYRKIVAARNQGKEGKELDQILDNSVPTADDDDGRLSSTSEVLCESESYFNKTTEERVLLSKRAQTQHEQDHNRNNTGNRERNSDKLNKINSERFDKDSVEDKHRRDPLMKRKELIEGSQSRRHGRSPMNEGRQEIKRTSPNRKARDINKASFVSAGNTSNQRRNDDGRKEQKVSGQQKDKERQKVDQHKSKAYRKEEKNREERSQPLIVCKNEKKFEPTKQEKHGKERERKSEKELIKDTCRTAKEVVRSSSIDKQRKYDHERNSNEPDTYRSSSLDRNKRLRAHGQEHKYEKEFTKTTHGTSSSKPLHRHENESDGRSREMYLQRLKDTEVEVQRRIQKREERRQKGEERRLPITLLSENMEQRSNEGEKAYRIESHTTTKHISVRQMKSRSREQGLDNERMGNIAKEGHTNDEKTLLHNRERIDRAKNDHASSRSHGVRYQEQCHSVETTKSPLHQNSKITTSDSIHGEVHVKNRQSRSRDVAEKGDKPSKRSPLKRSKGHQLPTLRHLQHDESSCEDVSKPELFQDEKHTRVSDKHVVVYRKTHVKEEVKQLENEPIKNSTIDLKIQNVDDAGSSDIGSASENVDSDSDVISLKIGGLDKILGDDMKKRTHKSSHYEKRSSNDVSRSEISKRDQTIYQDKYSNDDVSSLHRESRKKEPTQSIEMELNKNFSNEKGINKYKHSQTSQSDDSQKQRARDEVKHGAKSSGKYPNSDEPKKQRGRGRNSNETRNGEKATKTEDVKKIQYNHRRHVTEPIKHSQNAFKNESMKLSSQMTQHDDGANEASVIAKSSSGIDKATKIIIVEEEEEEEEEEKSIKETIEKNTNVKSKGHAKTNSPSTRKQIKLPETSSGSPIVKKKRKDDKIAKKRKRKEKENTDKAKLKKLKTSDETLKGDKPELDTNDSITIVSPERMKKPSLNLTEESVRTDSQLEEGLSEGEIKSDSECEDSYAPTGDLSSSEHKPASSHRHTRDRWHGSTSKSNDLRNFINRRDVRKRSKEYHRSESNMEWSRGDRL